LLLFTVCTYYVHINICKSITVNVINSQKISFWSQQRLPSAAAVLFTGRAGLISCRSRIHTAAAKHRPEETFKPFLTQSHSAVDHFEM